MPIEKVTAEQLTCDVCGDKSARGVEVVKSGYTSVDYHNWFIDTENNKCLCPQHKELVCPNCANSFTAIDQFYGYCGEYCHYADNPDDWSLDYSFVNPEDDDDYVFVYSSNTHRHMAHTSKFVVSIGAEEIVVCSGWHELLIEIMTKGTRFDLESSLFERE